MTPFTWRSCAGVADVITCVGGDDVFQVRESLEDVIREVGG